MTANCKSAIRIISIFCQKIERRLPEEIELRLMGLEFPNIPKTVGKFMVSLQGVM